MTIIEIALFQFKMASFKEREAIMPVKIDCSTDKQNLFKRHPRNPILDVASLPYQASSVFNPGAVWFQGKVLLLLRVEDRQGYSHLIVAESDNGKEDWEFQNTLLKPNSSKREAEFGLEDARIVWFEKETRYIIAYISFRAHVPGEPPGISLTSTEDFVDFDYIGEALFPWNKDASLFPEKINGKYALISRPSYGDRRDVWVSFSPDLRHWGNHRVLIPTRGKMWDAFRVGLGPPPIKTSEGWLIIYHGVRKTTGGDIYRVGLALLDLETLKVKRRGKEWALSPKMDYEERGDVHSVIFPSGAIVKEKTDELLLYYGGADAVVCLAVTKIPDILDWLRSQ